MKFNVVVKAVHTEYPDTIFGISFIKGIAAVLLTVSEDVSVGIYLDIYQPSYFKLSMIIGVSKLFTTSLA